MSRSKHQYSNLKFSLDRLPLVSIEYYVMLLQHAFSIVHSEILSLLIKALF